MALKRIYVALGLPVIAFLSFYWLRYKKVKDVKKQEPTQETTNGSIEKSIVENKDTSIVLNQNNGSAKKHKTSMTLNNNEDDDHNYDKVVLNLSNNELSQNIDQSTNKLTIESLDDQLIINSSCDLKNVTNNQSMDQTKMNTKSELCISTLENGIADKHNDDKIDFKISETLDNNLIEITNESFSNLSSLHNNSNNTSSSNEKSTMLTDKSNDTLLMANLSYQPNESQFLESNSTNLTDNNLSKISSNVDNNNDSDFETKSKQTSIVDSSPVARIHRKSIIEESLDNLVLVSQQNSEDSEANGDQSVKQARKLTAPPTTPTEEDVRDITIQVAEEALEVTNLKTSSSFKPNNTSLDFNDQFSTSLVFNSQNETTFNTAKDSSLDATINSTLDSIRSSTFGDSVTTLRSFSDQNDKKSSSITQLNEESNENESCLKTDVNSSKSDHSSIIEKQFTNDQKSSPLNSAQIIDEVSNDEKFLNINELEFQNDSKMEVLKEVVEDIKDKVVDNLMAESSVNSNKKMNENSNESMKDHTLNKSDDDSICIVYEGTSDQPLKVEKGATKSDADSKTNQQVTVPTSTKNLDESDDLEIIFESTKPQSNGNMKNKHHSNHNNQRPQTPAKSSGTQNHSSSKLNHQTSKENQDYCFEIPHALCGLLIGSKGSFINNTMNKSGASISVKEHPTMLDTNLCMIGGRSKEVREALRIIRNRFPLSKFPHLTLEATNPNLISLEPMPVTSNLVLPEGVNVEVLLSDFVTPSHLFLQQPTHPTFVLLQKLDQHMISTYKSIDAPGVDDPTPGIICAVQRNEGWYRAIVINVENDNCVVRLLDYGGFLNVSKSGLRQVQRDYMSIPFQAVECFLANIEPINGESWTRESMDYFKEVAQKQILQSVVVSYTANRMPLIYLYRSLDNQLININEELCLEGYANWIG